MHITAIIVKNINDVFNMILSALTSTPAIILYILYIIAWYVSFTISMKRIFEKAYIDPKYAYIPGVNIVYYLKMLRINPLYLLIPIANIFLLIYSPYRLGYEFDQDEFSKKIGIFFPIVYFPYIAFTDARFIHRRHTSLNINTIEDIDRIDKEVYARAKSEKNSAYNEDLVNSSVNVKIEDTEIDKLFKVVYDGENDEIIEEESFIKPNIEKQRVYAMEDIVELEDDDVEGLEIIEKIDNNKDSIEVLKDAVDVSEYKEIQEKQKSNEEIAFNITEENDEFKGTEKVLKCPDCGSDLIGYHETCPGCNRDVRSITASQK